MVSSVGLALRAAMISRVTSSRNGRSTFTAWSYCSVPGTATSSEWKAEA